MNPMLIAGLALALLLLAAVAAAVFGRRARPAGDVRYLLRSELLSPAERAFFAALDAAVGDHYRVFAMVRVADVIGVESAERGAYLSAFNRISAKHFDFVVCALDTLAPLAAIELNDASHQRPDRQKRDELLRGICRDIGLPLVELAPRRAYKLDSLRQQLLTAMGVDATRGRREPYAAVPRPAFEREPDDEAAAAPWTDRGAASPASASAPALSADAAPSPPAAIPTAGANAVPAVSAMPTPTLSAEGPSAIEPVQSLSAMPAPNARREPTLHATTVAAADAPRCPKCEGELQRRRLATGQLAGREFWLCRTFPACSGMLPIAAA